MMKKVVPFILALIPMAALASPFLTSDPYPATVLQPMACQATEGTKVYSSPVVKNTDGSVYCKIDISGITSGTHTVQVQATTTQAGVSNSAVVPFTFVWGTIGSPSGIQLVP